MGNRDALSWDLFCSIQKIEMFIRCAKRGFYRADNSIFSKIGRTVSEEVVLQIISSKCMPILIYGLETLFLQKHQLDSLDFVTNRLFMILFRTTDIRIISICQELFNFELPTVQLERRCKKFVNKFSAWSSI